MNTRLYHLIAVNDKTGARVCLTRPLEPVTHAEAVTIKSKATRYPWRRLIIEEVREETKIKTKLIHKSSHYAAYHHPEAGLIIQTTKDTSGRYMKPTHPQFNDYLQSILEALDSNEADALCRALYN